jgi:hypothetical protein
MLWFYAEIFSVQAEVLTLLAGNRWKLFHPDISINKGHTKQITAPGICQGHQQESCTRMAFNQTRHMHGM